VSNSLLRVVVGRNL